MQTEQGDILAATLDNLVRYSVTGCAQAARRAANFLERLAELGGIDDDMRLMYGHLSEAICAKLAEPAASPQVAVPRQEFNRAWLTWEWVDGPGRQRDL